MSANLGKCNKCGKTAYAMESVRVGPPGKEDVYHKYCFKCQNEGCTWQLNVGSYRYCNGKVYCKNHEPMTGFSNKDHLHGTVDMNNRSVKAAVEAQKKASKPVNEQIRGADCPSCNASTKSGAKFCGSCGVQLFTETMLAGK
mmetsp:Transcript_30045/g.83926  ORF Transcript_30045/g.83926 Transcript_30045/m.83926 type:complete len:142 (+) Transcript_30045:56-481(+)